jgi:hypothetical protein
VGRGDTATVVVLAPDGTEVASWPLAQHAQPDLAVVDSLARLQLVARRLGYCVRVRGRCRELRELLDLVGLSEVVLAAAPRRRKADGQTECGEEIGVEEIVMADDPIA